MYYRRWTRSIRFSCFESWLGETVDCYRSSTGLVESASQLSWSEVEGLSQPWEEESGEQEVTRLGAMTWCQEEQGEQEVARRSSTSSLNRVALTRTRSTIVTSPQAYFLLPSMCRLCHNSVAVAVPGFMVLPKEEQEEPENSAVDLIARINSVQVSVQMVKHQTKL